MAEEQGRMKTLIVGIITTVVGGLILAYALDVFDLGGAAPGTVPSPNGSEPATIYISGRLGPQQVSVQGTVSIDGEHAGVLTVNQASPSDEISHTVPGPGTYSYSVEVVSVALDAYGAPYESYGSGQGNIEVEDGAAFEVRGGPISGNTFDVTLVED
jgi:hypothetical protein